MVRCLTCDSLERHRRVALALLHQRLPRRSRIAVLTKKNATVKWSLMEPLYDISIFAITSAEDLAEIGRDYAAIIHIHVLEDLASSAEHTLRQLDGLLQPGGLQIMLSEPLTAGLTQTEDDSATLEAFRAYGFMNVQAFDAVAVYGPDVELECGLVPANNPTTVGQKPIVLR